MTEKEKLGEAICEYCPLEKKGVYGVDGGYMAGCEGSKCDEAYENYLEEEAFAMDAKEQSNTLLNELKLKLIGQNCFAQDNFKPEAAQAVESVIDSIMRWIKEKET
jgi:hypothetical protein